MIDKGQWWEFGQDTGVTPLLFTSSAMGFLMTTESQDLGLTSHPKDVLKMFSIFTGTDYFKCKSTNAKVCIWWCDLYDSFPKNISYS